MGFVAAILLALVALLLYLVGAFLWRDSPVHSLRLIGGAPRPHPGDPHLRRAFEVLTPASMRSGNRVELLENGDSLFPRLFEDLSSAKRLITWQVFWFRPGKLARQVAEVLSERARSGVEVLVLLDYYGAKTIDKDYIASLRDHGVQVQIYRPPRWNILYKTPHRSHVRSVVIDGEIGYTGGFGIDDHWQGDGRSHGVRDTHVRLQGPVVDQLQAPFVSNWAETTGEMLLGESVMRAADVRDDGMYSALIYCAPSLGSTTAERFLALSIFAAKEYFYMISPYFVPPRGFRELLSDAARRGVDVRILTPGGNTDRISTWYAGRCLYEELLASGVQIYEYKPTMVHAKLFVADGVWCSVGSVNMDNRSLKLNDEVNLVCQDAGFGELLRQSFLKDLGYANEVILEDFRKRPLYEKAKERATLLFAPLM